MDNKTNFDKYIKYSLELRAEEADLSEELLHGLMRRVKNYEGDRKAMTRFGIKDIIIKKCVIAVMCGLLVIGGVTFTFSEDVRAATMNVLDKIKTVFVMDILNGEQKVVEMPANECYVWPMVGSLTELSDEELTQKMGFNVAFPDKLLETYRLVNKTDCVAFNSSVSYEVSEQLTLDFFKAVEDEEAMSRLSQYNLSREVLGDYEYIYNSFSIHIQKYSVPLPTASDVSELTKTKVGDVDAIWIKNVITIYRSATDENGITKSDMTSKPVSIGDSYSLRWISDGIEYGIISYSPSQLTMEETIRIAEEFMKYQK